MGLEENKNLALQVTCRGPEARMSKGFRMRTSAAWEAVVGTDSAKSSWSQMTLRTLNILQEVAGSHRWL